MRILGVVTGLESEARAAQEAVARARLDRTRVLVHCEGPGQAAAETAAAALIGEGANLLMSFGLAGALEPDLAPGTLSLPRRIVSAEGPPLNSDSAAVDALAFALASAVRITRDDLVSVGMVVETAADKVALAQASHAVAVDMESYSVARVAEAAGLPFLVLRAIADSARQTVPKLAQAGMGADGRIKPWAVLRALARRPQAIGALARLAHDTDQGMRALGRAARLAFPVLLASG